jgi:hypothetical protein
MNRRHPFARKLATSAAAICLGFGVTMVIVSPAQAATTCTLTIGGQDSESGRYPVFVSCSEGGNWAFGLYGDDPAFDDFQGGPFFSGALVLRGVLNEDDSFFDRQDEIYALVGAQSIRTNNVVRNF